MIMMPYAWTLDITAAHRSGRLLAPHRRPRSGWINGIKHLPVSYRG